MGKYSNVKYEKLKTAAENALNDLSVYSGEDVKNSLNGSYVLTGDIRKKVMSTLKSIDSDKSLIGSLESLKINLKRLVSIADLIEDYQELEEDIDDFKRRMDDEKSSHRRKLRRMKEKLSNLEDTISEKINK